ncbi:hypothetical protein [Novosphingobium pentaromativorans]|uniref:hypothetical protein n=1 Tax=Novosphingobium pentaromativorans TaxID=205844 RepID=UPI001EEFF0CC|nr:hypothetical protein [Novosphingobium pentaromativorans]
MQFYMFDTCADEVAGDSPDFTGHRVRGGRNDDLAVEPTIGKRHGNGQAMPDLVYLIMIEEKSDAHMGMTPPPLYIRTFSDKFLILLYAG